MQLLATEWICPENGHVEGTSKMVTSPVSASSPGPTLSSFLFWFPGQKRCL